MNGEYKKGKERGRREEANIRKGREEERGVEKRKGGEEKRRI